MKKLFLSFTALAIFGIAGCNKPSGISTDSTNHFGSNANSEVISSSNMNVSANTPITQRMNVTGDDEFLIDAAQGGMAEVELGRLAAQKATNPDVKKFG